ncbi:MAG: hypothetical protein RLZZ78_1769 [Armatimonadota bacterium]
MENGPEMSSQAPIPASSADEVVVEDVTITDSDVATPDPVDDAVDPVIGTEDVPETATQDSQEAPAPQAVQLFDLGDDLATQPDPPAFDMTEEAVESVVSSDIDSEAVAVASNVAIDAAAALTDEPIQEPTPILDSTPADDEIFEQVMGSSRVEDIPAVRRSAPGSIPLPPQVVMEQQRRDQAAATTTDASSRKRHPLPETGRQANRQGAKTPTPPPASSQTAPQAVDVICPKCQRTTSTRFTFCMKCGTDFPVGYIASLTGHHPQPSTPSGRGGVRDTRTTVRQINSIHEGRGSAAGMGAAQASNQEGLPRLNTGMLANPFLVAFLSFLMPGLGHMLIGEHKKGLPWLFAGIAAMAFLPSWSFAMWVPLFLRVFSAINAYQLAIIKQDEQSRTLDSDDDA